MTLVAWLALILAALAVLVDIAAITGLLWVLRRPQLVMGAVAGAILPDTAPTGATGAPDLSQYAAPKE